MKGNLVRKNGQFVKGHSGNPKGRPVGSKNAVTAQKLLLEQTFREDTDLDVSLVLKLIVKQALDGDKPSQKLVWDASVSKANHTEDKTAGSKQSITIHRMEVKKQGDIIDVDIEEDKDE